VCSSDLSSTWVLDLENLAESIFGPRSVVVHGDVSRSECLHDHLDAVRWQIVRELKAIQAITDVAVNGWIVDIRPFVHLTNGHIAVHNSLVLVESVRGIVGAQIVRVGDSWHLTQRCPCRRNAGRPQSRTPAHTSARDSCHGGLPILRRRQSPPGGPKRHHYPTFDQQLKDARSGAQGFIKTLSAAQSCWHVL